jgi:hypothetical protein
MQQSSIAILLALFFGGTSYDAVAQSSDDIAEKLVGHWYCDNTVMIKNYTLRIQLHDQFSRHGTSASTVRAVVNLDVYPDMPITLDGYVKGKWTLNGDILKLDADDFAVTDVYPSQAKMLVNMIDLSMITGSSKLQVLNVDAEQFKAKVVDGSEADGYTMSCERDRK